MSFKESTPSRSSRFSLETLRGKQHSTGSISIRFHAASADSEDEDDVLFTDPQPSKPANSEALQFEVKPRADPVSLTGSDALPGSHGNGDTPGGVSALPGFRVSRSAPVSEVATPVSDIGGSASTTPLQPVSEGPFPSPPPSHKNGATPRPDPHPHVENSSFFSGLKEKLQDPMALLEKIAADSPIIESIDRKLRRKESLDPPSRPVKSVSGSELSSSSSREMTREGDMKKVPSFGDMPRGGARVRHASVDNEMLLSTTSPGGALENGMNGNHSNEGSPGRDGEKGHSRSSSIEIVDDFYQVPEARESPAQGQDLRAEKPFIKSASSDQFCLPGNHGNQADVKDQQQHVSRLQKLRMKTRKQRSVGGERPVSVSLSGLLSSQSDSPTADTPEDDLFYDPKEDTPPVRIPGAGGREDGGHPLQDPLSPGEAPLSSAGEDPPPDSASSDLPRIPSTQKTIAAVVAIFAYLILPLPSYMSGMVVGAVLAAGGIYIYQWWTAPPLPRKPFILPDLSTLPPLKVPEMKESKNEDGNFKGWMNEINHYDPEDYHINLTHSIYVTLEGTTLRLQTPKTGIPKRAMWDESIAVTGFVHQRYYDLQDCRVFLQPLGLVKKRLWSKKYPICLVIPQEQASQGERRGSGDRRGSVEVPGSVEGSRRGSVEMTPGEGVPEPPTPDLAELGYEEVGDAPHPGEVRLYLFGRTGREKEEWYRRLLAASKGSPFPTRTSDLLSRDTNSTTTTSNTGDGSRSRLSSLSSASPEKSRSTPEKGDQRRGVTPEKGEHRRQGSTDSDQGSEGGKAEPEIHKQTSEEILTSYLGYMAKIMPAQCRPPPRSRSSGSKSGSPAPGTVGGTPSPRREHGKEHGREEKPVPVMCEPQVLWANALIGRLFWDMLREKYWNDKIREKIQKKLSKIHVPYFIDELTVTGIELGPEVPIIRRASQPYIDDRGLWVDLDIAYGGGFCMSMETKCNLMKLKKKPTQAAMVSVSSDKSTVELYIPQQHQTPPISSSRSASERSPVTDSDEEDSAESSTDEEEENVTEIQEESKPVTLNKIKKNLQALKVKKSPQPIAKSLHTPQNAPVGGSGNTSKKILRIVDKIAQSKYFQQATENKYIKKALEEVSNLRLILNVELKSLVGTLSVNIPPPPTDRVWYGFRNNPHLWLSVKPRVGEREVNVSHITDWIEKKLAIEFQRVFVMPNMDDLPIPLMCDYQVADPSSDS